MKSKSVIPGADHSPMLDDMIREIVKIAEPEKILLLSASYDYELTEDIFINIPVQKLRSGHYRLLLLFEGYGQKSMIEQEIQIRRCLFSRGNPDLHCMDIHEFNDLLKAGNDYYTFLLLNAILWYDRCKIPFFDPKPALLNKYYANQKVY